MRGSPPGGHPLGLVAAVAAAAVGCGPIQFIATVPLSASGAIAAAERVDADKHAPYEITAAREYIHKARDLAGYSRFQSAIAFGRKADRMARKAKQLAIAQRSAGAPLAPVAPQPTPASAPVTPAAPAPPPAAPAPAPPKPAAAVSPPVLPPAAAQPEAAPARTDDGSPAR